MILQIYIFKDGQQQGPYSIDELNDLLKSNAIIGADFCWYEGCESWIPLSSFPGFISQEPVDSVPDTGSMKYPTLGNVVTLDFFANEKFILNAALEGGMGIVYQLVPVRPGKPFALKTFQSTSNRASFERECEIWLSLSSHPNIARAVAYGFWCGKPAVLVEWYESSLAQTNLAQWTTGEILDFVTQVVDALAFAFAESLLVHQDIKPANILLEKGRQARLTDFGLARCVDLSSQTMPRLEALRQDMNQTVTAGLIRGTPLYMPPEMFSGARASLATDIYSLGVTIYEALTGEHPYIGEETDGYFEPVLRTRPLDRIQTLRNGEIAPLIALVADCVSLDPGLRPPDYLTIQHRLGCRDSLKPDFNIEDVVSTAVAHAALCRRQERYEDAANILLRHLEDQPNNPVLLNALGALRVAEGKKDEGIRVFENAVALLMPENGFWKGSLYLDPFVNLARQNLGLASDYPKEMADLGKKFGINITVSKDLAGPFYSKATDLLQQAWRWILDNNDIRCLSWFPEFGWMFLYQGNFGESSDYLLQYLTQKAPDIFSLQWLIEAAWLAGRMKDIAPTLGQIFLNLQPSDFERVLCACLVAGYSSPALRDQLLDLINDTVAAKIGESEREAGLPAQALRPPCSRGAECLIIRTLDHINCGEKHYELIR